jgi:hypothetical protein
MRTRFRTSLLAGGVVAFALWGRAGADGVPTSEPLFYTGRLLDVPDGPRSVVLYLWSDASATDSALKKCETVSPSTPVVQGTFRVALDATCLAAVRSTPDLWIEPVVAGVSQGRRKLGAVPFSIEADHAATATRATGALDARIAALEQQVAALSQGLGRLAATGTVSSGTGAANWTLLAGTGERYVRLPVKFSQPFPRPPAVSTALSQFDMINMFNARLEVTAEAVTTDGFTVVLHTWADSQVYSATVTWTALLE